MELSEIPWQSRILLRCFFYETENASCWAIEEVGEGPGEEDDEFVAETDEEHDVDEEPSNPSRISFDFQFFGLYDGGVFPDDSHDAFVVVVEVWAVAEILIRGGCFLVFFENFGDVFAHLHGGGCESGDFYVVGVGEGDEVSSCEDIWVSGDGEIWSNFDTTAAISCAVDFFGEA